MSIKGFSVNGVVQRYDYTALDNLPQGQGVSDDLKAALLQLAQKVAYIDDQGQTYYDNLYDALYPEKTLLSIAANFQQGQAVVYNTDSLDSLKQYLTVTATYDDASTETVPSSAYTLSGTLTTGTSVITVTYEGKTDAFNVVVTAAPIALTVTNNLTGCTTSNSATAVLENTSYTAVITASSGYTLVGATVSITMGGNDITTSAYSGGIITINSVTGALVISVAAVAVVLNSISAVYTQSGTVYDTDSLDSLKTDLVVTAHYSNSSTQTVPAADYTLSGTLTEGTSTITVSYGGKTTTFNVTVSVGLDSIAYGTKTYRDIFITDNVLGWFGDFESDFEVKSEYTYLYPTEPHGSGYRLAPNASASPSVSTSEYNSPGHSINVSSSGATKYMSAYTNGNVTFGEDYIFAFTCKVPSYSAGKVELQAFGNSSTVIRAIQAAETNGWTPVLVIGAPVEGSTPGMLNFNFGALGNTTYGNPNFTAYMDDLVCTPLPDGMTQEQALTAFAKYLEIRRNA